MSYRDHLTPDELAELEQAKARRDAAVAVATDEYRLVYRKLKARADSRIRTAAGLGKGRMKKRAKAED